MSPETNSICLDLVASVKVPVVLPDGSTNVNGVEQMRTLIAAHQELLAARQELLAPPDRE
jgi:hypothetical protein